MKAAKFPMIVALPVAAAILAAALPVQADDTADAAGSVAVTTVPVRRGSLPRLVIAYGTAGTAPDASVTISQLQDGRIGQLDVAAGQVVRAGTPLLQFAPSPGAASTYQQAVSALALARTTRDHTAQLLVQRLATRDQLAQADKAVSDAQSSLAALRGDGGGIGPRAVPAPFDGVVASVAVAQGDRVAAGAALLVLTRAATAVVQVGVEPAAYPLLQPGQPVTLASLDGAATATGTLRWVAGALDAKSHLLNATIAAGSSDMLIGGAYRAAIEVGSWQGWLVPHAAVLTDDAGAYLFQRDGSAARKVAVRVLGTDALQTASGVDVVDGALVAARPVIVDGASQLEDGGAIRNTASPAAAGAEAAAP